MASRLIALSVVASVIPAGAVAQQAQAKVEIKEWPVPWENSGPRDPHTDAQGRVWFVGQRGNYIAYLNPQNGEFKRFEIDEGTNPHNLIVDQRGVWYAGNRNARIGRLDPATGEITRYMMPDEAARDPHTLVFDKQGNIWFTVQGGNRIGHLDTKSGEVHLLTSPAERSRPYGIKVAANDHPWIVLFGTNKLATVDPATMQLRTIDLPRAEARPRRIEITSDQKVWYMDHDGGMIGRYDPATRQFKEWPSPGGANARPYGSALDDKGVIWYVETGVRPNKFVGFDTRREAFVGAFDIPSGGGAVRHMMFDPRTRFIWFGTDTGNMARAIVP